MVREIRIYIEGGGQDRATLRKIRSGFVRFFEPLCQLARRRRILWSVIPCGSRNNTFKGFKASLSRGSGALIVLLVDSEEEVSTGRWEHLRRQDGWDVSGLAEEDQCHFMVRAVEAWIVADPDALEEFYGQGFHRKTLSGGGNVETIRKEDLLRSLDRATSRTKKGKYWKIEHCAELLKRIDPGKVRSRAPHCDLLFKTLESRLAG